MTAPSAGRGGHRLRRLPESGWCGLASRQTVAFAGEVGKCLPEEKHGSLPLAASLDLSLIYQPGGFQICASSGGLATPTPVAMYIGSHKVKQW